MLDVALVVADEVIVCPAYFYFNVKSEPSLLTNLPPSVALLKFEP